MDFTTLLPLITGGGGAIVVLVLGYTLMLREELVTGRQYRRALALVEKLEAANDILRTTNATQQNQVDRLLDGAALSNTLAQALVTAAQQPKAP